MKDNGLDECGCYQYPSFGAHRPRGVGVKTNVASSSESGQVAAKKLSIKYFGSAAASSNPELERALVFKNNSDWKQVTSAHHHTELLHKTQIR